MVRRNRAEKFSYTKYLTAELLLKHQQLKALNQPSQKDYNSVLNFMENNGGALCEEENSFIYEKEDMITLRPGREHAWLDRMLEGLLQSCRCKVIKVSDPDWFLRPRPAKLFLQVFLHLQSEYLALTQSKFA